MKTKITLGTKELTTYPFDDPDFVPATAERRYPYFRYDGSTATATTRTWQTITLENDRIAVTILPEVGGKVWSAYDKFAQREFLYTNHVMKFRDISLRGPWLSGGIEFNFGILGHAPSTSTPVDWCTRENADGSASCFVSSDEYITRTRWQVEIFLAPEADEFETRVIWYNGSGVAAPYYHWMNAAYSLRHNPQFLFPGEAAVGHEGEIVTRTWPTDAKGRDMSIYANNCYGGPKSYHVLGGNTGFFGIWWNDLNYGSYHRSLPYAKYGRKIWLWALSREGGIWEDLLTDSDGQYAELQSGRCFNQPRWDNIYSPFKHPTFVPGSTETFTDHWGPIRARADVTADENPTPLTIRPLDPPAAFDFTSARGLAILGVQALREREDALAEERLAAALTKDPTLSEALVGLAELAYRHGDYARVHDWVRRALQVDLYDREANYLDGAAYFAERDFVTARDRLGVAAFPGGYRAAALALIARSFLAEGNRAAALEAAEESLRSEGLQVEALLVKAIALRGAAEQTPFLKSTLARVPLFPALRYEDAGVAGLKDLIRNELPCQTYLELGSWYEETGLTNDAAQLFRLALPNPEAEVRLAFLEGRVPQFTAPMAGVCPFRRESRPALEAAVRTTADWRAKYLLATLLAFFRETERAQALLESCGNQPNEAVFYLYRARMRKGADALADLQRAQQLADSWRVGRDMLLSYEATGDFAAMRTVAETYLRTYPTKNPLQIGYARALVKLGCYRECMAFLTGVQILPSEHRDSATDLWHECQKHLQLPLTWPENLGKGEPYHDDEWRQKG